MHTSNTGRWGIFGGRYVAQALWEPLAKIAEQFSSVLVDDTFSKDFDTMLKQRVGRPTALTELHQISPAQGARLWLKREDLAFGGSFCSTLALFQVLMAKSLGYESVVTETSTGDFGLATASLSAMFQMKCRVYMRQKDAQLLSERVAQMRLMGAQVELVDSPLQGRRGARDAALRYWSAHPHDFFYCTSLLASPDPYPRIIAHALSWVGAEAKIQCERAGIRPDYVVAPIGSGGFASGFFQPFIHPDVSTRCIGVQASGQPQAGKNASSLLTGSVGIFHGTCSMVLQDEEGQLLNPYSLARGVSEVGVGPQHAYWSVQKRVLYVGMGDQEAQSAAAQLLKQEGIFCSLESAHAMAYATTLAQSLPSDQSILVGLTGRGHAELQHYDPDQNDGKGKGASS